MRWPRTGSQGYIYYIYIYIYIFKAFIYPGNTIRDESVFHCYQHDILFSRLAEYNLNVDEQMNNGVASKYNAVMTDD